MSMKDRLKKAGRVLLIGAIWVYVLSIPAGGQLLFDHAHGLLVQNAVVQALQREAKSTWSSFKAQARLALAETNDDTEAEVRKF